MAQKQEEIAWTDKRTVAAALLGLYSYQTADEQGCQSTLELNNRGFNGIDAPFCSSVAEWILADKPFTPKQHKAMSRILPKYARQIRMMDLSNIDVPQSALDGRPKQKIKSDLTGDGRLGLDEDRLMFTPNIYPSNQIKRLGFKWKKSHWIGPKFNLSIIGAIQRMFPEIVTTNELNNEILCLETKARSLPKEIEQHSILFDFQKEAIQFLINTPHAMLALAPGLGKTACSLFAADLLKLDHVLIVGPLSLTQNWRKEIEKWLSQKSDIWHGPHENWRVWSEDWRWAITNYSTAIRNLDFLEKIDWDLIIIDESVMIKNRKAQRTKAMKRLSKAADRIWLLTGAPITRFYDDMWSQLNLLDSRRFSSYWRFAGSYCEIERNQWGAAVCGNQREATEWLQSDLLDMYFCRTQDEVLDLPDWIFDDYEIALSESQHRLYQQMENDFLANLPEGNVVLAPNVLAQLTRLIQLASNPVLIGGKNIGAKWDAAVEMLEYEQGPFIIWTTYVLTAEAMCSKLAQKGYRCGLLTGKTKVNTRQPIIDQFQTGQLDVLIAHPGVGKFGHTLTTARTAIYLERSYNGDDYYQSLHRVRRIGTQHSPHIIHLLASSPTGKTTVDHVIAKVLEYRKESNMRLTSGELRKLWE